VPGVRFEDAASYDLPYLLGAAKDRVMNVPVSSERLMPVVMQALRGLGLDAQIVSRRVLFDLERRPQKSARAATIPIRIPDEIVVCVSPLGLLQDLVELLHESGHALHHVHVRETRFAYANYWASVPADNGVCEAYAYLSESRMRRPEWILSAVFNGDNAKRDIALEIARFNTIVDLYFMRKMAGKILFEAELYGNEDMPDAERKTAYTRNLRDALKVEPEAEDYLISIDRGFYSVAYLHAPILLGQLREVLEKRFGRDWWQSKKAGRFLKRLWGWGVRYDAGQLSAKLGFESLDLAYCVRQMKSDLSWLEEESGA